MGPCRSIRKPLGSDLHVSAECQHESRQGPSMLAQKHMLFRTTSFALFQASDIVRGVSRLRDFNMPVFVAHFCLFVID